VVNHRVDAVPGKDWVEPIDDSGLAIEAGIGATGGSFAGLVDVFTWSAGRAIWDGGLTASGHREATLLPPSRTIDSANGNNKTTQPFCFEGSITTFSQPDDKVT